MLLGTRNSSEPKASRIFVPRRDSKAALMIELSVTQGWAGSSGGLRSADSSNGPKSLEIEVSYRT